MGAGDVAHPYRSLGVPFTAAFRPQADPGETAVAAAPRARLRPGRRPPHRLHPPRPRPRRRPPRLPRRRGPRVRRRRRTPRSTRACATAPATPPATSTTVRSGPPTRSTATPGTGFESVRLLPGDGPEILLIPLVGHSRGHTGVAVRDGDGWLLHCGDAYFHRGQMEHPARLPAGACACSRARWPPTARRAPRNEQRLNELARDHGDEVRLFCAHDPVELERATAGREPEAAGPEPATTG